jgi:hypothetical protein
MNVGIAGRIFAACIAAAAWIGLIVQWGAIYSATSSVILSLWIIFAYFTIITNLLVSVVFTFIAINRSALRSGWIVAGTMLSIVMVGVINALLLWGALELSGGSALVDKLLHIATPALVPLFWVFFVPKGGLTWRHPLLWAVYPLLYLAYGIARGVVTGKYAYPFLDALSLGWQRTALNAFFIAAAFMVSGFAVVWIDRLSATNRIALK